MKQSKSEEFVNKILHIAGFIICIAPPALCTLLYFPLWKESAKALSGGVVLLLIIAAWPFYKTLKEKFKSPSASTVWLALFIIFFTLAKIAEEMTVISLVGFISNVFGAFIFRIAKRGDKDEG